MDYPLILSGQSITVDCPKGYNGSAVIECDGIITGLEDKGTVSIYRSDFPYTTSAFCSMPEIDGCAANDGYGGCMSTKSVCVDVPAPGTGNL